MKSKTLLLITGISGALAVALGAMGAHALEQRVEAGVLTDKNLASYKTAVLYHMIHTLVLLGIVALQEKFTAVSFKWSTYCFLAGILFFSGSVYLLSTSALTGIHLSFLGPVTPIGGVLFIAGWLLLGFSVYRGEKGK